MAIDTAAKRALVLRKYAGIVPAASVNISVDPALETDTAQPITVSFGTLAIPVGTAAETNAAEAITPSFGATIIPVGVASETDAAETIVASFGALAIPVGTASETNTAELIAPSFGPLSIAISAALETDSAFSISASFGGLSIPLNPALESDAALPISPTFGTLSIPVGTAAETDAALEIAVSVGALNIPVGAASETDTAEPITPAFGALSVPVGTATETDTALSITASFGATVVAVGTASETDAALPVTATFGALSIPVDPALEVDVAESITPSFGILAIPVGTAAETDTAEPVTPAFGALSIPLGAAIETDAALPVSFVFGSVSVALGVATETDSALPITLTGGDVSISVGTASETDAALSVSFSVEVPPVIAIGVASETDYALPIGVNRVDLPQYALVFEEHLDPIKKRGKIVLQSPLADGQSLLIRRKTPIVNPYKATALEPFNGEAFENALDRICFIQQEIEGHLCDCRGDTYPPPVVPPLPPECEPYDCAAFATELFNAGWEVSDFSNLQGALPILVPASFSYIGDPTEITPQPDKIGDNMVEAESFTSQYYLWNLEGDIDVCPGVTRGLGLGENTQALPQGFKLFMNSTISSATTMTYGGISNSSNGSNAFWRRYNFTVNYNGGSQTRDQTLMIRYIDGQGFYSNDGSTDVFMGNPTFNAGVNLLWMETTLSNITVEDIWLGYAAQRFNADFTARVQVNDQFYEVVRNVVLGQAYPAPISLVNDYYDQTALFSGMTAKLYVIAGTTDPVNLGDLLLWYQRNFADYTPPGTCPSVETTATSSTPPAEEETPTFEGDEI